MPPTSFVEKSFHKLFSFLIFGFFHFLLAQFVPKGSFQGTVLRWDCFQDAFDFSVKTASAM